MISKKSGLIYEQRLILKYIQENGKDPITGDVLYEDDLLEIKASKYHRKADTIERMTFIHLKIHYQLEGC